MSDLLDFFSTCSEFSNEVFLFFELYHFLIIMRHKCQKTEFFGGHLGFLAAILNFRFGSGQNSKALGLPQVLWKLQPIQKICRKMPKNNYFNPHYLCGLVYGFRFVNKTGYVFITLCCCFHVMSFFYLVCEVSLMYLI